MVFLFVCYQSHQSEPEEDQSAAVSESDEQVVNSDQPESTVDDKSEENNSVAPTDGSEEGSGPEVIDDSDADGDWEPKVGSGGEQEVDEEDEEEYECSDDALSGRELTQIARVQKENQESDPSSPVEKISDEVLDQDKTMDYVDSEVDDVVPDTPPNEQHARVKVSLVRPKNSPNITTPVKDNVGDVIGQTKSPSVDKTKKTNSPSNTGRNVGTSSLKNYPLRSNPVGPTQSKPNSGDKKKTSGIEKNVKGPTKTAMTVKAKGKGKKAIVKPLKVKLFHKKNEPSPTKKKGVLLEDSTTSKHQNTSKSTATSTNQQERTPTRAGTPELVDDLMNAMDNSDEMVTVVISSQDKPIDPEQVAVADNVLNSDLETIKEFERKKAKDKAAVHAHEGDSDSDRPPGKEKFGDKTKPKNKSSAKHPAKSSSKKRPHSPAPPTPPRVVTKKGSMKRVPEKSSKGHKSAAQAAKTFSELRTSVGTEHINKKKKVDNFEADYDDEGGAGPSHEDVPISTRNPLTSSNKSSSGKPKGRPPTKKNCPDKSVKSVEEEKVEILKELAAKYGTHATPIIINPPQINSPTPSVISASMRGEEEEDDLNIWGRLIVRKLRKFKDKKMQEDVQNFIHVLVTDAERGEWRKPASLTVNPNSPHMYENRTPERLPQVTHIIRSPRVSSNPKDQAKTTQSVMRQDSSGNQGVCNPPQRIPQPNVGVGPEEIVSNFAGVAHQQVTTARNSNLESENTEFMYTLQASHATLAQGQHNPHIYLNYNQFGGERQVDNSQQQPSCSGRTYTQLQ